MCSFSSDRQSMVTENWHALQADLYIEWLYLLFRMLALTSSMEDATKQHHCKIWHRSSDGIR